MRCISLTRLLSLSSSRGLAGDARGMVEETAASAFLLEQRWSKNGLRALHVLMNEVSDVEGGGENTRSVTRIVFAEDD
jgi:hypothetical protein